jgi:hypothetical protein
LEDILQRPAHPVIAAGDKCKRRTFTEQLHSNLLFGSPTRVAH